MFFLFVCFNLRTRNPWRHYVNATGHTHTQKKTEMQNKSGKNADLEHTMGHRISLALAHHQKSNQASTSMVGSLTALMFKCKIIIMMICIHSHIHNIHCAVSYIFDYCWPENQSNHIRSTYHSIIALDTLCVFC